MTNIAEIEIERLGRAGRRRVERELEDTIKKQFRIQMRSYPNIYNREQAKELLERVMRETLLRTTSLAITAVNATRGVGEKILDDVRKNVALRIEQVPMNPDTYLGKGQRLRKKELIDMLACAQKETMFGAMDVAVDAVSSTKGIGEKRFVEVQKRIAASLR